jgi:hypothetical protein
MHGVCSCTPIDEMHGCLATGAEGKPSCWRQTAPNFHIEKGTQGDREAETPAGSHIYRRTYRYPLYQNKTTFPAPGLAVCMNVQSMSNMKYNTDENAEYNVWSTPVSRHTSPHTTHAKTRLWSMSHDGTTITSAVQEMSLPNSRPTHEATTIITPCVEEILLISGYMVSFPPSRPDFFAPLP